MKALPFVSAFIFALFRLANQLAKSGLSVNFSY
jgi:hypothetical protein